MVASQSTRRPPADILRRLRLFWAEAGRVPQHRVAGDTHLLDLGVDSLGIVSLEIRIATQFGIDLPDHAVIEAPTPDEMAELVAERLADASPPPLPDPGASFVVVQRGDSRAPVFAVPGGDGVSMARLAWMARLTDPDREVVGLSAHTDPPDGPDWLARRAAGYADEIAAARPAGPVLLFGDCLGALVAWETAAAVRRLGVAPVRLLLLDPLYAVSPRERASDWHRRRLLANAIPSGGFDGDLTIVCRAGAPRQPDAGRFATLAVGPVDWNVLPSHLRGHSFRADAMPLIVAAVRRWLGDADPAGTGDGT